MTQATSLECEVNAACPAEPQHFVVPYGFYNEATGFAAAAALVAAGHAQPQFAVVGNLFAGSKDTVAGFLLARNYQLVERERWFLDLRLLGGRWGELKSFQSGNPAFPQERAGSNASSKDNFLEAEGTDYYYRMTLRYLLPIGNGAEAPIHIYRTRSGLLEPGSGSGGEAWNPWRSGLTQLELEPFYRKQSLEQTSAGDVPDRSTAGITLRLDYDNTDWPKNPSYGSRVRIAASRDWGAQDGMPSWTQLELDYAKFLSLGQTGHARQRVLAFAVYTSDVPTWNEPAAEGPSGFHRPPVFAGSTLGGLERQRGFEANRFSDKAAINYQLEYRHVPVDNPLARVRLLEPLRIRWIQYAVFVEFGRVSESWRLDRLHEAMKQSYGAGLRVNALGLVVRADLCLSEEGYQVQMFVGQAF